MRVHIQSYISRPDYKLYLGIKRDEKFGPVLLFGIGGIYSLLIGERNLGLPPLNRLLARQLMENTRAFELLNGYRDRPGANLEQLEELLIRLSQLAIDFPQIERLDIHPRYHQRWKGCRPRCPDKVEIHPGSISPAPGDQPLPRKPGTEG